MPVNRNYRRFEGYLLNRRDAGKVAASLGFQTDVRDYLDERARTLDWRLRSFAKQITAGRLEDVALEGGRLKIQPLSAITLALDRKIDALLSRVRITELLVEVATCTGLLSAFRDLRSGKEHDNPHALLAAILAHESNLGLERMVNASDARRAVRAKRAFLQPAGTNPFRNRLRIVYSH